MRITVKELIELNEAKVKSYQGINRLSREFYDRMKRMEAITSIKQASKLDEKLSNLMKALTQEEIRVKSFWEQVRERHEIMYPWQVEWLVGYSEDFKLGEEDSIEFKF